jgi:hypothetical protein
MKTKKAYKIPSHHPKEHADKILEKISILERYIEGENTLQELADEITERRLNWLKENKDTIDKYQHLDLLELAHGVLFLEHLKVGSQDSIVEKVSDNKIRIRSYNPCPYLEACNILGLDTQIICKEIGEPSCKLFVKAIHPSLDFSRTYGDRLRPYCDHCEEFIEVVDSEPLAA